jgi:hypothetical protein
LSDPGAIIRGKLDREFSAEPALTLCSGAKSLRDIRELPDQLSWK